MACPASCKAMSVGTAKAGVPMKTIRTAFPFAPSLSKGRPYFVRRQKEKRPFDNLRANG